jgi:hypothetical protein
MIATVQEASWVERNQAYLVAELASLKRRLRAESDAPEPSPLPDDMDPPPAIDLLAEILGLSAFEKSVLLLCAGFEMDSEIAALCGQARGSSQPAPPTFGLALSIFEEPHWTALRPDSPLRRFRLVEIEASCGLTSAPLGIDERVLHFLAGANVLDPRIGKLVRASAGPDCIASRHAAVAAEIARVLQAYARGVPVIHLCGDDQQGQEDVAAAAAESAGLRLYTVRSEDLQHADVDQLNDLWPREALLMGAALFIQSAAATARAPERQLAEKLPVVFLGSREPIHLNRPLLRYDIDRPDAAEQQRLWELALGQAGTSNTVGDLAAQFRLSARTIATTGALAADGGPVRTEDLWNVCRSLCRPRLENLAERLTPTAGWEDLVLPERQIETLRRMASQIRHRMVVCEQWGFSGKSRRGLGISALFAGESGTGKTLAAEVLARDLELDLYRVDVSAVVSKYIGETSKNMRQVFDAAEEGGALLLFDEADALFGKRSEVKDSHDRYANIDISYLLQRMESYQGVSILTTNLKSAVDRAFQRRLRFTLNFPFPDFAQREEIWRRIFPPQAPIEGLDFKKLAQLNVAGGNIRNIALNAAFMAAAAGRAVTMTDLLSAARLEAEKMERPLSEAEIRLWL